ncbi:ATP-binding protein [Pseudomonas typographi]|uniref:DNA mismatch repair protein n=1 Tax=Pseudomonas typographi TaxID=2715964 RepID=A0ABR7ZAD3_9PSED|nr:ATP-binding protein [Pseudomonas typographi]MBD1602385.1 DNA mismatch repair protein [Pseudomonas typographi]
MASAFKANDFSGNTKITDAGIRNNFSKSLEPWSPLVELIWNGFDANAKNISIITRETGLNAMESITILDDGDGIDFTRPDDNFLRFRDSLKKKSHNVHGEKGIGRLAFHKICNKAIWYTKFKNDNARIEINSSSLSSVTGTTIPVNQQNALLVNSSSGTCVELLEFIGFFPTQATLSTQLSLEFGWYLALNPSKTLTFNGEILAPPEHSCSDTLFTIDSNAFRLKLLHWKEKPASERSYTYYTTSSENVIYHAPSSLNKKPNYHTTLSISSPWFDAFSEDENGQSLDMRSMQHSKVWKALQKAVGGFAQEHYKAYLVGQADEQIQKLVDDGDFPDYSQLVNSYSEWRLGNLKGILRIIIISEPRLFKDSNKRQRKIIIRLLDKISVSNENDAIFDVLEGILDLDEASMLIFSDQIKTAKLNNIIQTIEKLQKREAAISRISEIMLNHYNDTLETPDLQGVIESNTWLFGNQYETIGAEETTFTVIAENLRNSIAGITEILDDDIDDGANLSGANRQVDLFLVRGNMQYDSHNNQPYFRCVIVEIKRPSIALNKKHLRQIDDYAGILAKHPRFNGIQTRYEIILLGRKISPNDYDISERLEQLAGRNDPGLVGGGPIKKYVKTWQTIIEEFRIANDYLLSKLQTQRDTLESSKDDLLKHLHTPTH